MSFPADEVVLEPLSQIVTERRDTCSIVRLRGELNVTSATELKGVLLGALAEGRELQVDLEAAEAIDISIMQLLWATGRAAERRGTGFAVRASEAVALAARDAGFERWPR